MPRYKVLEKSYLDFVLREPGEEIEFAGLPGPNLQPLDDEGKAKVAEYEASDAIRRKRLAENYPESGVGDPDVFVKKLADAMAAQTEAQTQTIVKLVSDGVASAFAKMFPNGLGKPPAP